jgi:hypothetical protein
MTIQSKGPWCDAVQHRGPVAIASGVITSARMTAGGVD